MPPKKRKPDFGAPKAVSLQKDFTESSHVKLWLEYKEAAGLVGQTAIDDLREFAEYLLSAEKPYKSTNVYLSAVVAFELARKTLAQGVFFEREYSSLRDSVNKELARGGLVPTGAPVLSVRAMMKLSQQERRGFVLPLMLGWRDSSLQALTVGHVDVVGGAVLVTCPKDKVRTSVNRVVSIPCCCDDKCLNHLCVLHGCSYLAPKPGAVFEEILPRVHPQATTHSLRRTLAVQVRLWLVDLGYAELDDVPRAVLGRINTHFGWTSRSLMFERYSRDFAHYAPDYRLPIRRLVEGFMAG